MNLRSYINPEDDYFTIPEDEWEELKASVPKEELLDELADIIIEYPLPHARLTEDDARRSYQKLKGYWWGDHLVEGGWFARESEVSKYHFNFKDSQYFFPRSTRGDYASNYFHIENRFRVGHARTVSPEEVWKDKKKVRQTLQALWTMPEVYGVNRGTVFTCLRLRQYVAAQFKPSVAKSFYDYFEAKNVLDFSMGWGDRLAGFYASNTGETYVGLDPNTALHEGYAKQVEMYEEYRTFLEPEKTVEHHPSPAEDFDFTPYKDFFDVVFTSPPYFNIERYTDQDTQSWKRYSTSDDWVDGFLLKTLANILPSVKRGGYVAINIADIYSNGYVAICNPMNDFLASQGLTYLGAMGLQMMKRPNTSVTGRRKTQALVEKLGDKIDKIPDLKFCEPIWIWQKPF